MANSAASILATGQAIINEKYNKIEQRRKVPSVMQLAVQNQDYSFPDIVALRTSPLRPVEAYFRKNIAPGTDTTKSAFHQGSFGDTGAQVVNWISHVEKFGIPYKIGANNKFTQADQFANSLYMAMRNIEDRQDNSALAFLASAKCQLAASVMNPQLAAAGLQSWSDTTLALSIAQTDKLLFAQKIKSAMKSRFMGTEFDVIADIISMDNFRNQMNQGGSNAVNLAYQFVSGLTFTEAQIQIDAAYPLGAVYVMPKGMLAGLCWNEQLNITGLPNADLMNSVGQIGTMPSPFTPGLTYDISMYVQRVDTSSNSTGGSPQDFVLQVEVTATVGYVTAPLSISLDSSIMEIGLSS